jgi:hypothetical protein
MGNVNKTLIIACCVLFSSCKIDPANLSGGATVPATAATQGFFLDNWQPKMFTPPYSQTVSKPGGTATAQVTVNLNNIITRVSNYEFGNNLFPFMGPVSTDAALMSGIKKLSPNIIRFPGSQSDMYFWNQSSQPPADAPSNLLDPNGNAATASYYFGKNTAGWTMTIDNYYSVFTANKQHRHYHCKLRLRAIRYRPCAAANGSAPCGRLGAV